MSQVDLKTKFPKMTPIKRAPSLFRMNGCGVGIYGHRDEDAETGAYVTTLCICILFVPLVCLRAYRVANARQGWYFLGREPLSSFAKRCNLALLAAVVLAASWVSISAYTSTPGYKARARMAEARHLVKQGRPGQAAKIYESLALAGAEESANAIEQTQMLVEAQAVQPLNAESVEVFTSAVQVARRTHRITPADIAATALKMVTEKGTSDPRSAVGILEIIRPLSVDTRPVDAQRLVMLRKWVQTDPTNLAALTPLASLLEQANQLGEARTLLMPVKDRLGDGEGARVLGLILARDHDYDGAYGLLWPYVRVRLDKLHAAEKMSEQAYRQLVDRELELLRANKGPADFYTRYEAAGEDGKQAVLRTYVNERIKSDPTLTATQQTLEQEAAVVPVAMDLGIIVLQRAQAQADPAIRKTQLEAAEKVFLAISGIVGQTDEYRLSLGQVYYWLGKQEDGHKLFDEFLASKDRSYEALMGIANKLRQLGADPDARTLVEEAYGKATKSDEKYAAASFRSLCFKDSDDEMVWLQRCNTSEPAEKARLASAFGAKAFREGHDAEAIAQYHEAINAYGAMPRSATTLNQTALAYYAILSISGDHKAFEQCVDYFQQAVDLEPQDSILLYNAGVVLLRASLADIIGNEVDLRALHDMGSTDLLAYLYHDQAGRDMIVQRVKEHPGIRKALSYLDKTMVVSPKGVRAYAAAYDIYQFTRDEAALRDLEQRIRAAGLDTSDQLTELKEALAGVKDQQNAAVLKVACKRMEDQSSALRSKGGTTLAVALDQQAVGLMKLDFYGGGVDADKPLLLTQEAMRLSPSWATSNALVGAYLFRANRDLCARNTAFAAWYGKYHRAFGPSYLLVVAASEPGPFQQEVLSDPDFQKALGIYREEGKRFTESSAYCWAMIKAKDPSEAQRMAEKIRQTPRQRLSQAVQVLLTPANPSETLEMYWMLRIYNEPGKARDILSDIAAAGVPLPVAP